MTDLMLRRLFDMSLVICIVSFRFSDPPRANAVEKVDVLASDDSGAAQPSEGAGGDARSPSISAKIIAEFAVPERILGASLSPDATQLAIVIADEDRSGSVQIWDIAKGRQVESVSLNTAIYGLAPGALESRAAFSILFNRRNPAR